MASVCVYGHIWVLASYIPQPQDCHDRSGADASARLLADRHLLLHTAPSQKGIRSDNIMAADLSGYAGRLQLLCRINTLPGPIGYHLFSCTCEIRPFEVAAVASMFNADGPAQSEPPGNGAAAEVTKAAHAPVLCSQCRSTSCETQRLAPLRTLLFVQARVMVSLASNLDIILSS